MTFSFEHCSQLQDRSTVTEARLIRKLPRGAVRALKLNLHSFHKYAQNRNMLEGQENICLEHTWQVQREIAHLLS